MTGRCVPNLLAHTVTKTEDKLEQQILHTFAHHGAFLAIDAIDPVGTMDERFFMTCSAAAQTFCAMVSVSVTLMLYG